RRPARRHLARRARRADRLDRDGEPARRALPALRLRGDRRTARPRPGRRAAARPPGGRRRARRPRRGNPQRGRGRRLRPAAHPPRPGPRRRAQRRPRSGDRRERSSSLTDAARRAMKGVRAWLASSVLGLALALATPAAAEPERLNRLNLRFNQWLLEHALEPMARGYNFVVPKWGQRRVIAFMGNLDGPRDILNSLAQAKVRRAGVHSGRLLVNTTAGVVGLFDVAGDYLHWTASPETFDETLGVWRLPPGTYIILPVIGDFCTRSLVGWTVDGVLNPLSRVPGPLVAPTAGAYLW